MGMVWVARIADDAQVTQILQEPEGVDDFINSDEAYESDMTFDVDKQWHAIHYLLTGSADATSNPLSFIIGHFSEVGSDNGYGPAWLIPKESFIAFNSALSALTNEDLAARYDADAMVRDKVYIAEALQEEGAEGLGFLLEDIERLRKFVARAAADNVGAFGMIT